MSKYEYFRRLPIAYRPDRLTEVRQAAERLADARDDELTPPAGDDRAYG